MSDSCEKWMLTYYDDCGYEHGYGLRCIPVRPSCFKATDLESKKQVWYYAESELEQRFKNLEIVAYNMLQYIKGKYIPYMTYTDECAAQEFEKSLVALGRVILGD